MRPDQADVDQLSRARLVERQIHAESTGDMREDGIAGGTGGRESSRNIPETALPLQVQRQIEKLESARTGPLRAYAHARAHAHAHTRNKDSERL